MNLALSFIHTAARPRSKIALSALWGEREGPRRDVSRKPSGLTRGAGEGEVGDADEPRLPPPAMKTGGLTH